jgi:hypothetical protein
LRKVFVCGVCKIEHCDVIRCGFFADEFPEKGLREWTKQPLKTLEEATELYMVEEIAEVSV